MSDFFTCVYFLLRNRSFLNPKISGAIAFRQYLVTELRWFLLLLMMHVFSPRNFCSWPCPCKNLRLHCGGWCRWANQGERQQTNQTICKLIPSSSRRHSRINLSCLSLQMGISAASEQSNKLVLTSNFLMIYVCKIIEHIQLFCKEKVEASFLTCKARTIKLYIS